MKCQHCKTRPANSRGKYCSLKCCGEAQRRRFWVDCAKCHALIGLGVTKSARILGTVRKNAIAKWKKKERWPVGHCEGCNSWSEWRKVELAKFEGRVNASRDGWLAVYYREWMNHVRRNRFPDWGHEWAKVKNRERYIENKEYYKKRASDRYASMTMDERREFNKRCTSARKRRLQDPEELRKYREWHKAHREKLETKKYRREYQRKYTKRNYVVDSLREYRQRPENKAVANLRRRLRGVIKGSGGSRPIKRFGCSGQFLKEHIERQFIGVMSWDNYGTAWHIDHIIPVASFDHSDPRQVEQCWHFTNLRPLWAKTNMKKGASVTNPQFSLRI